MEPRIQYAKTDDGVSIAYTVLGSGRETLVCAPSIWGDLHMYRSVPLFKAWFDALAGFGRRIVIFDSRNMGASQHRDTDFSASARLSDLEAVIGRSRTEQFDLYAFLHGCSIAVQYAVAERERVRKLVLFDPFARGADYYTAVPEMAIIERLGAGKPEEDHLTYLSIANIVTGFADHAFAAQIAEGMRSSMSGAEMSAYSHATRDIDISELLPRVSTPTLVIFTNRFLPSLLPLTREVARLIPNAEFVESIDQVANSELNRVAVEAVDAFLHDERRADTAAFATSSMVERHTHSVGETGVTVVMFADIASSTALTEQMGDAAFRVKARELHPALHDVVRRHGGTVIEGKLLGDGMLATFSSAHRAIEAALACVKTGDAGGMPIHVGLHAGDVIREQRDVFGGTVNIAARISEEARTREVLVSQTVRELARTSASATFDDAGDRRLKGVEEPLRVWRVTTAPPSPRSKG